ncbi:MAG: hypothetical protein Q9208_006269 [Pyrenodesmia sp. 3 TL-2023]
MAECHNTLSGKHCTGLLSHAAARDVAAVSAAHHQDTQIIRTVTFEFCSDCHCSWASDSASTVHLLVSHNDVVIREVDQHRLKAISYAWGDFERTNRLIGHDVLGNPISMQLGADWNTEDFTNRLARLAFEHGACWIDQLCIPQKDAEIRKALASIPTIYRTFDVIVLMPGAPCKCVHEALETLEVAYEYGDESEYSSVVNAMEPDRTKCLSMLLCSSWFHRLWTRQELLYSRCISLAWTGMIDAPCVRLGKILGEDDHYLTAEHALHLPPFARLLYEQAAQAVKVKSGLFGKPSAVANVKKAVLKGSPSALVDLIPSFANATADFVLSRRIYGDTEAGRLVSEKGEATRRLFEASQMKMARQSDKVATGIVEIALSSNYRSALTAFGEYVGESIEASGKGNIVPLRVFRFFAGEVIENGSEDPKRSNEMSQVERFLHGLSGLRGSGRTSTQAKDYVNSVWVDCPQFEVHARSKDTDLPTLLEDALRQLHLSHQIGIMTTFPCGILGIDHLTGQWKPSSYLSVASNNAAAHVYGPMTYPAKPLPLTPDGTIPLRVIRSADTCLSWMAVDYENFLAKFPTRFMFHSMKRIASLWPPDLHGRSHTKAAFEPSNSLQGPAIVGRSIAGSLPLMISSAVGAILGHPEAYHSELLERQRRAHETIDTRTQEEKDREGFRRNLLDHRISRWDSAAEVNHFQVVYKMVTDALGIDHELCRSRGLRLMVSRDPPCIGLADRAFPSRCARIRAGLIPSNSLKTVCVAHGQGVHGSVLYEVEKVDGVGTPRYRVFGVWAPMRDVCLNNMYAIAENGATDAYIV